MVSSKGHFSRRNEIIIHMFFTGLCKKGTSVSLALCGAYCCGNQCCRHDILCVPGTGCLKLDAILSPPVNIMSAEYSSCSLLGESMFHTLPGSAPCQSARQSHPPEYVTVPADFELHWCFIISLPAYPDHHYFNGLLFILTDIFPLLYRSIFCDYSCACLFVFKF